MNTPDKDTTNADELFKAAQEVAQYLHASGDCRFVNAVYLPPAEQLRRQADEIEKKDAAIRKFKKALARYREGS